MWVVQARSGPTTTAPSYVAALLSHLKHSPPGKIVFVEQWGDQHDKRWGQSIEGLSRSDSAAVAICEFAASLSRFCIRAGEDKHAFVRAGCVVPFDALRISPMPLSDNVYLIEKLRNFPNLIQKERGNERGDRPTCPQHALSQMLRGVFKPLFLD